MGVFFRVKRPFPDLIDRPTLAIPSSYRDLQDSGDDIESETQPRSYYLVVSIQLSRSPFVIRYGWTAGGSADIFAGVST